MANIPLLQTGCTGQEVIDTINALVAAHNEGQAPVSVSYEDLSHKPKLNGVEISGDMTTKSAKIKILDAEDYDTYEEAWATKAYADQAKSEAVAEAQAAVEEALDSKLDKDLGNIEAVDAFPGDAVIPIVTGSGVKKTTLSNVAAYTEITSTASRTTLREAVKSQLRILPLSGDQDGSNVEFSVKDGYNTGTSSLFFNGQLLTAGKDYTEESSYGIVMLTHIPVSTDVLIFMAVPLD